MGWRSVGCSLGMGFCQYSSEWTSVRSMKQNKETNGFKWKNFTVLHKKDEYNALWIMRREEREWFYQRIGMEKRKKRKIKKTIAGFQNWINNSSNNNLEWCFKK